MDGKIIIDGVQRHKRRLFASQGQRIWIFTTAFSAQHFPSSPSSIGTLHLDTHALNRGIIPAHKSNRIITSEQQTASRFFFEGTSGWSRICNFSLRCVSCPRAANCPAYPIENRYWKRTCKLGNRFEWCGRRGVT